MNLLSAHAKLVTFMHVRPDEANDPEAATSESVGSTVGQKLVKASIDLFIA